MEFRCATAPGKFGEKMVMRFLNSNSEMLNLDTLISNEKYEITSGQSSTNQMELLSFLDQPDQGNQQHLHQLYAKRTMAK